MTIDWWELLKSISGFVGAATGGLALFLNRRDAKKARLAQDPRATILLNPHPETDGWHILKLTFDNVRQPLKFTSAEIVKPRRAVIAPRRKNDEGAQVRDASQTSRRISVNWTVNPPMDGKSAAGLAHLNVRLQPERAPEHVVIKLHGHYISGMQEAILISAAAESSSLSASVLDHHFPRNPTKQA